MIAPNFTTGDLSARSLGEGGTLGASNIEKATVSIKKEMRGETGKKEATAAEKAACSIEAMRNGEECEACQ